MDHGSELRRCERQLRERVSGTLAGDSGVTPDDREWIMAKLAKMQQLFRRHLSGIPEHERQYEAYRLEFALPLWSYLSRTYELFYLLESEATRSPRVPAST